MQYPLFTDFQPSCSTNAWIQQKFGTGTSHEYRYFLQQNADELMKMNRQCAENQVKFAPQQSLPGAKCDEGPSRWKPPAQFFFR